MEVVVGLALLGGVGYVIYKSVKKPEELDAETRKEVENEHMIDEPQPETAVVRKRAISVVFLSEKNGQEVWKVAVTKPKPQKLRVEGTLNEIKTRYVFDPSVVIDSRKKL